MRVGVLLFALVVIWASLAMRGLLNAESAAQTTVVLSLITGVGWAARHLKHPH
jgi:hypothetical protein